MKRLYVTFISALLSINAISQDIKYRKDERSQNAKEIFFSAYQSNHTSEYEYNILRALEIAGIRIFNIPISPVFEKEYNFSVNLIEYVNGEKVKSQDIIYTHRGKNVYLHSSDDPIPIKPGTVPSFDFIPKLTFFSKENDTTVFLTVEHYGGTSRRPLKKNKVRDRQFYNWRVYSQIDWKLNEEVPLLVFASSWYDERIKQDRFCGIDDLSLDEKATKELLDFSPHYYVISLKVYE